MKVKRFNFTGLHKILKTVTEIKMEFGGKSIKMAHFCVNILFLVILFRCRDI